MYDIIKALLTIPAFFPSSIDHARLRPELY